MKYLIIGSNSFSGGSFIDYLLKNRQKAKIYGISRSKEYNSSLLAYRNNLNNDKVHFYQYDLNNDLENIVSLIEKEEITYIINFSAQGMVEQSWTNPEEWFTTNTLSIVKLLDRIYKFDFIKKFLQVSTPEVYGSCKNIKESMNFQPSSPYAASKASADLILYSYFKTRNFPVNFTRAANVYGSYQQLYRIIPKTILMIKKNKKLQLQGRGRAVRSFIHINDVSIATLKILEEAKSGEIYHLSDSKSISIYDLVDLICQLMNKNIQDYVEISEDRIGQDNIYLMNADKIQKEFSLIPQISLKEGILSTIQWIEENYETLKEFPDYYIHKK